MKTQSTLFKFVTAQFVFALILSVGAVAQNQQAKAAAQGHLARGREFAAQQKWHHAIAEYDQALVIDSKFAAAYDARGMAWLRLKDFGLALRDFNRALKLTPENAWFYVHRAQAWQAKGEACKVEQDLARYRKFAHLQYAAQDRRGR